MDNLLFVVAERDKAVNMLETGETGQPGKRWTYNILGIGHWKQEKEFYKPVHHHHGAKAVHDRIGPWTNSFKVLLKEKRMRAKKSWEYRYSKYLQKLEEKFPGVDLGEENAKLQKSKKS